MCSEAEKRDIANIAMLACALGCDALYEQGYIAVAPDGGILVSPHVIDLPDVDTYISGRLAERTVTCWTATSSPYFHWHRTHTFKDGPQLGPIGELPTDARGRIANEDNAAVPLRTSLKWTF